jgi:hypothetical protein
MLLWLPFPGAILSIAGIVVVGCVAAFLFGLAREFSGGDQGEIVDEIPPHDEP